MKKIFFIASLLCLIAVGVNANPDKGKVSKKSPAAKTTVTKKPTAVALSTTALSDTTHKKAMAKKHYKKAAKKAPAATK